MNHETQLRDWATQNPQVQSLAARHRVPVQRAAGLYARAVGSVGGDAHHALQLAERCLQAGHGDPSAAMRHLHLTLPWQQRARISDGSTIKATLPVHTSSRALVGGESRDRVERFVVDPDCRVLWAHQDPNPWRPGDAVIGAVLAARDRPVTGDLEVWVRLGRLEDVEAALFSELAVSPGIALTSEHSRGRNAAGEPTRTWTAAHIRELSLCPAGDEAMAGVTVTLELPPDQLVQDWDMASRSSTMAPYMHVRGA